MAHATPEDRARELLLLAQRSDTDKALPIAVVAVGWSLLAAVEELGVLRGEVASLTKATYSSGGV